MSLKSILQISSYTVSKSVRFFLRRSVVHRWWLSRYASASWRLIGRLHYARCSEWKEWRIDAFQLAWVGPPTPVWKWWIADRQPRCRPAVILRYVNFFSHVGLRFLANRANGRAYATVLRPSSSSVCLSSVTLCIVAKWCVLEQMLLLIA